MTKTQNETSTADSRGAAEVTGSVPKRRFGITLTAGGNSLEDIVELLEHIAREMTVNPGIMGSTIGGCDYGGHYDIEDRGEHITPASYRQALEDWLSERRARNEPV